MSERLSPSWRPQRQEPLIDPAVKRMAMIAGGVAGVVMLAAGGYSMIGRAPRQVPVIEADPSPVRVRPKDSGTMPPPAADELTGNGTETMAPPPEVPQPQALQAEIKAAHPPAPVVAAAPPPVNAVAPPPALAPAPAVVAKQAPAPVPAPAPAPAPAKTVAVAGKVQVQLAAMESEESAKAEWTRLTRLLPAAFSGRHPQIERTERDGHTFWRLRTAGFADAAAAGTFCTEVKAKHAGCAVAAF